jgi:hypothetical protein
MEFPPRHQAFRQLYALAALAVFEQTSHRFDVIERHIPEVASRPP